MGQRGRKKGASGEKSRLVLLGAAAEEFAEKGYYGAKVNNIVQKAGLTQLLKFFKQHPAQTRIGFFLAEEAESIKKELAERINSNLIAEQEVGYFKKDMNMTIMAEGLVGMIERLTITQLFTGLKEPEEVAGKIVTLLLVGVLTEHADGDVGLLSILNKDVVHNGVAGQ